MLSHQSGEFIGSQLKTCIAMAKGNWPKVLSPSQPSVRPLHWGLLSSRLWWHCRWKSFCWRYWWRFGRPVDPCMWLLPALCCRYRSSCHLTRRTWSPRWRRRKGTAPPLSHRPAAPIYKSYSSHSSRLTIQERQYFKGLVFSNNWVSHQ